MIKCIYKANDDLVEICDLETDYSIYVNWRDYEQLIDELCRVKWVQDQVITTWLGIPSVFNDGWMQPALPVLAVAGLGMDDDEDV